MGYACILIQPAANAFVIPLSQEPADPLAAAATIRRRRASRAPTVFLAVSIAAHAAVATLLPGLSPDPAPVRIGVLEVTVQNPEPLPVAVGIPQPAAPRPDVPQPERPPEKSKRDPRAGGPVLALAKTEPEPAGSFSVAPARLPERLPPAPEAAPAPAAVTPPRFDAAYLSNPAPQYPSASRRAGEQGTVLVRVLVKRDGLPARVELEKSSGSPHLDAAARDAVWAWRFLPALQGTDAIESWVVVPVVFRLEGPG